MFTSAVFTALFGSAPVAKNGKVVVRMNAANWTAFSAKWAEMGGNQNARQGTFYHNKLGILTAWG